jgi:flagellar basal-body rod modification protein FlgD
MNVNPLASNTPATDPTQQSMSGLTGDSFLTLLTAQLKSQDPTQPTDPTAFVGQLVQFNTLQQIIEMRQLLQQLTGVTTATHSATVPAQNQSQQQNVVG